MWLSAQQRADLIEIDNARKAHPGWNAQIREQQRETMVAVLYNRPFSWLPTESVLKWIRSFDAQD